MHFRTRVIACAVLAAAVGFSTLAAAQSEDGHEAEQGAERPHAG